MRTKESLTFHTDNDYEEYDFRCRRKDLKTTAYTINLSEMDSLDTAIVRGSCQEKRVKTDSSVASQVQKIQASPILRAERKNKETVSETYVESNDLTVDGSVGSSNMKSEYMAIQKLISKDVGPLILVSYRLRSIECLIVMRKKPVAIFEIGN